MSPQVLPSGLLHGGPDPSVRIGSRRPHTCVVLKVFNAPAAACLCDVACEETRKRLSCARHKKAQQKRPSDPATQQRQSVVRSRVCWSNKRHLYADCTLGASTRECGRVMTEKSSYAAQTTTVYVQRGGEPAPRYVNPTLQTGLEYPLLQQPSFVVAPPGFLAPHWQARTRFGDGQPMCCVNPPE